MTNYLKFFYSGNGMYNLYNFEPKQGFLENFRKTQRIYRAAEIGTMILIFASAFLWLFV